MIECAANPPTSVCAFNVGDAMVCRCVLPRGHTGYHRCVHSPTPETEENDRG